jgi:hypothetical protein
VAQNSAYPQCFQFIQDRLHNCSSHSGCPLPNGRLLPKRIIALGSDNESLSLYEAFQDIGLYAALSYCWGKGSTLLKTTQSTLETFKDHIPWEKLPRTLQDAVVITRKIGLKFLWIDCLCIVQDSRSDWEIEATKMGQYYCNAFITLGASSSSDSQSGIFVNRPKISPPKEIRFKGSDAVLYSIVAQRRDTRLWPSPIWQLGPLSERAWTFQEHALSARMIHFTDAEIIWECHSEMLSEDGHPIRNNSHGLIQELQQKVEQDPENCWRLFVRAYSERSLTFLDDKLPAIAGIAAHFQQQTGFHYVAGLWRETLMVDLVWVSWGWEELDNPPSTVQAPSWSWVSIHGGVAFDVEMISEGIPIKTHCTIEDVQCNISGQNPFGLVKDGRIEVTGPLLEIELEFNGDFDDFGIPLFTLTRGGVSVPLFSPDTSLEHVEIEDGNGLKYSTVQRSSKPPTPFQTKVWCLWCFTADEEPSEMQTLLEKDVMKLHGIVLAKSALSLPIYHRIGAAAAKSTSLLDVADTKKISII